MRSARKWAPRALAAALTPALIGCAQLAELTAGEAPPPCPETAIVAGLDRAYVADPDAPERVGIEATLEGLGSTCAYANDAVDVELEVDLRARPARGYAGGEVTLAYFVALIDPAGEVVGKSVFETDVAASILRPDAGVRERIVQRIDLSAPERGPEWRVLLGFDLDRESALARYRDLAR